MWQYSIGPQFPEGLSSVPRMCTRSESAQNRLRTPLISCGDFTWLERLLWTGENFFFCTLSVAAPARTDGECIHWSAEGPICLAPAKEDAIGLFS